MFLVAFNRVYSISRIKVWSGVGFVDQKITAFRLLYCNEKGGASIFKSHMCACVCVRARARA